MQTAGTKMYSNYNTASGGINKPVARLGSSQRLQYAARRLNTKYYELKDHLGNVRATVSDQRTATGTARLRSATAYYPFGMIMPGRSFASGSYRFGFNGKEMDNETGLNSNLLSKSILLSLYITPQNI